MAGYVQNNNRNGSNSGSQVRAGSSYTQNSGAAATGKSLTPPIFSTGMFVPDREGVKALASIQVKEDVLIPAGSYISIYHNEVKKTPTSPDYRLMVKAGKLKTDKSA